MSCHTGHAGHGGLLTGRPTRCRAFVRSVSSVSLGGARASAQVADARSRSRCRAFRGRSTICRRAACRCALIRGELSNNIADHPGRAARRHGSVQTVKTDAQGRAQFDKLPAGATVKAVAVVDGERLESQEFPAPAQGGIRLMLVATDKEKAARSRPRRPRRRSPARSLIGGETRIVIEPGDEIVAVYYLLDIVNNRRAPVNPPTPFVFDMPAGATGHEHHARLVAAGDGQRAARDGERSVSAGQHARPGRRASCRSPAATLDIDAAFPATLEQLARHREEGRRHAS